MPPLTDEQVWIVALGILGLAYYWYVTDTSSSTSSSSSSASALSLRSRGPLEPDGSVWKANIIGRKLDPIARTLRLTVTVPPTLVQYLGNMIMIGKLPQGLYVDIFDTGTPLDYRGFGVLMYPQSPGSDIVDLVFTYPNLALEYPIGDYEFSRLFDVKKGQVWILAVR